MTYDGRSVFENYGNSNVSPERGHWRVKHLYEKSPEAATDYFVSLAVIATISEPTVSKRI